MTEIAFAVSFVMGWIFVMIGLKTLRRYRNEFKAAYFIGFVGVSVAPVLAPEAVDWREIEVLTDRWGRPGLRLGGRVLDAVERSLGVGAGQASRWSASLSHDGDWAAAIVLALAG